MSLGVWRERERKVERERAREREKINGIRFMMCVWCLCVWSGVEWSVLSLSLSLGRACESSREGRTNEKRFAERREKSESERDERVRQSSADAAASIYL